MLIRNMPPTRLIVPHDPQHWIDVRPLSGPALDRARDVQTAKQIEAAKRAGPDFIRQVQEARAKEAPKATAAPPAAPTSDYDADTLVNAAFVGCSWGEMVKDAKPADELDPQTRDWLAKEVEALNVRPLASGPASGG